MRPCCSVAWLWRGGRPIGQSFQRRPRFLSQPGTGCSSGQLLNQPFGVQVTDILERLESTKLGKGFAVLVERSRKDRLQALASLQRGFLLQGRAQRWLSIEERPPQRLAGGAADGKLRTVEICDVPFDNLQVFFGNRMHAP